ncbi:M20 metallopeptidase family protein [Aquibacillus sediminis]|uniref:M20 metallopeptidase family protein n=1 Tax=Aquibacillus sediminis TaxID=2574734 RepID=UPI001109C17B|nr:M20 family metallopeptidase [Aquibacillus sediminis]
MQQQLYQRLEALYPDLVEIRRDLHMYPELSFQEVNTPKKVANFLQDLGLDVRTDVGGRGVVGYLKGGKPGKTIALRADFDALPIQDEKDVPYKSKVDGVMHACGHDLHTATLLGVAKVLSEVKENLHGTVVFIHQFAEEQIPGGAQAMIEDGCLDGVDVIYGAHVWSPLPVGTVGIVEGNTMAAGDSFDIQIDGKGGHGAQPHLTVDAITTGVQLVSNIQNIVSRRVDPLHPAVVTVGTFEAGQAFNVIADKAKITGTVRTFDENTRDLVEEEIKHIAHTTCEGAGATAQVTYQRGYPAVWNHPEPIRKAETLAKEVVGKDQIIHIDPSMAMEDFAYYLKEIPGAFLFIGGRNEQLLATYPHHHPKFNVDERAILHGGKMFISLVLDFLTSELKQSKSVRKI